MKFWFRMMCLLPLLGASLWSSAQSDALAPRCANYALDAKTGWPMFVRFLPAYMPGEAAMMPTLLQAFGMDGVTDRFLETKRKDDALGFTHVTLQHLHLGYPVFGSVLKAHLKAGKLESFAGRLLPVTMPATAALDANAALTAALHTWGASQYKWEIPGEEAFIKNLKNDPQATFYPKGELVFVQNRGMQSPEPMRLAWRFDIYAHAPATHAEVFVDAVTGETINRNELMHTTDVPGTASTRYSGVQTIISDSTGPGAFRLREATHGQGVETYNIHNTTNYGAATDFTQGDRDWNTFAPAIDRAATDAHWGAEMTYEYYFLKHGRDSYDDNGSKLMNYVHYDQNLFNANWNGFVMNYGDGGGNNVPFTTIDICGHELTHGVTQYAASLIYQDESGALNESFSDIFGNTIERYARPGQYSWQIAEDFGAFRSMSNPNQFGNPDTYLGTFWATGPGDNGGVHTNSGVQNYWYYLLVDGGAGTNDNGDGYNITGLGLDTAAMIAYRNLNVYMTANADYALARYGAIQSAIDLFGECSPQMIQTWNAWAAVGVGTPYTSTLAASYFTPDTNLCALPFAVNFTNTSTGAIHYLWKFGDGTTSTAENPSHVYIFLGNYAVTLIAYGCNGTTDTIVFPDRIHIDINQICPINMPAASGTTSSNACEGILYDSGGGLNYNDNVNSTVTISPNNGSQVQLIFQTFNYASGDRITIYDGVNVSSPQIGVYSGTSLPPVVTSTSGSLTIKESTNGANNRPGFSATWSCVTAAETGLAQACKLYPNPSQGLLHLAWPIGTPDAYAVEITDLQGKLQQRYAGQHSGNLDATLDLSALSAGVYFMQVRSAGQIANRKVIVE